MIKVYMESDSLLLRYKIMNGNQANKRVVPVFAASSATVQDIISEYKRIGRELVGDEASSLDTQEALIWDKKESPIMKTLQGEDEYVTVHMRFHAFERITKDLFFGNVEHLAEYLVRERDRYRIYSDYRKSISPKLLIKKTL